MYVKFNLRAIHFEPLDTLYLYTLISASILRRTAMHFITIAVIIFHFGIISGFLVDDDLVTVQTPLGNIVGFLHSTRFDNQTYKVKEFLGIPYAEPPTGDNRFKKPVLKAPFTSPFRALKFGPACLQREKGGYGTKIPLSEDCLSLNIFVPASPAAPASPLPVMVWIHGGGFVELSTHIYFGDVLSAFGEVIIVTIQYRLGFLGFLATGEKTGNFGLWDQHLAIKWVHNNIKYFGGDESKITVFGESSGASSVVYQTFFPGNKGLFQRAISESGSITSPWAFTIPYYAHEYFVKVKNAFGCSGARDTVMSCLRNKTTTDIINITNNTNLNSGQVPSLDNDFVPVNPKDMQIPYPYLNASFDVFNGIDLLIGGNSLEGGQYLSYWAGLANNTNLEHVNIPRSTYETQIIPSALWEVFSNLTEMPKILADATTFEYTNWTMPDDSVERNLILMQMTTDYTVFAPMVATAQAHADKGLGSTYLYKFSTRPSKHLIYTPKWLDGPMEANHVDEILFVWGFSERGINTTEQDVRVSKAVMTMWTNFAKTGYVQVAV